MNNNNESIADRTIRQIRDRYRYKRVLERDQRLDIIERTKQEQQIYGDLAGKLTAEEEVMYPQVDWSRQDREQRWRDFSRKMHALGITQDDISGGRIRRPRIAGEVIPSAPTVPGAQFIPFQDFPEGADYGIWLKYRERMLRGDIKDIRPSLRPENQQTRGFWPGFIQSADARIFEGLFSASDMWWKTKDISERIGSFLNRRGLSPSSIFLNMTPFGYWARNAQEKRSQLLEEEKAWELEQHPGSGVPPNGSLGMPPQYTGLAAHTGRVLGESIPKSKQDLVLEAGLTVVPIPLGPVAKLAVKPFKPVIKLLGKGFVKVSEPIASMVRKKTGSFHIPSKVLDPPAMPGDLENELGRTLNQVLEQEADILGAEVLGPGRLTHVPSVVDMFRGVIQDRITLGKIGALTPEQQAYIDSPTFAIAEIKNSKLFTDEDILGVARKLYGRLQDLTEGAVHVATAPAQLATITGKNIGGVKFGWAGMFKTVFNMDRKGIVQSGVTQTQQLPVAGGPSEGWSLAYHDIIEWGSDYYDMSPPIAKAVNLIRKMADDLTQLMEDEGLFIDIPRITRKQVAFKFLHRKLISQKNDFLYEVSNDITHYLEVDKAGEMILGNRSPIEPDNEFVARFMQAVVDDIGGLGSDPKALELYEKARAVNQVPVLTRTLSAHRQSQLMIDGLLRGNEYALNPIDELQEQARLVYRLIIQKRINELISLWTTEKSEFITAQIIKQESAAKEVFDIAKTFRTALGPAARRSTALKQVDDQILKAEDNVVGTNANRVTRSNKAAVEADPMLPNQLRRSAPRYQDSIIEFESDIDRALYIVANPKIPRSASDPAFIQWLQQHLPAVAPARPAVPTPTAAPAARVSRVYRTSDDLAQMSDQELIQEAITTRKDSIPGLGMESTEFSGTYLSTEAANRYLKKPLQGRPAFKLYSADITIKNPRIFRSSGEYAEYHEAFLPKEVRLAGGGVDDDALGLLEEAAMFASPPRPNPRVVAGRKATASLKKQGYDSVYLPESDMNEGILVVFDKKNVRFGPAQEITDDLLASELRIAVEAIEQSRISSTAVPTPAAAPIAPDEEALRALGREIRTSVGEQVRKSTDFQVYLPRTGKGGKPSTVPSAVEVTVAERRAVEELRVLRVQREAIIKKEAETGISGTVLLSPMKIPARSWGKISELYPTEAAKFRELADIELPEITKVIKNLAAELKRDLKITPKRFSDALGLVRYGLVSKTPVTNKELAEALRRLGADQRTSINMLERIYDDAVTFATTRKRVAVRSLQKQLDDIVRTSDKNLKAARNAKKAQETLWHNKETRHGASAQSLHIPGSAQYVMKSTVFKGTDYPTGQDAAKALAKEFGYISSAGPFEQGIVNVANTYSQLVRMSIASADLSYAMIQGQYMMGMDMIQLAKVPIFAAQKLFGLKVSGRPTAIFPRGVQGMFAGAIDPRHELRFWSEAGRIDSVRRRIRAGGLVQPSEFGEGHRVLSQLADKIPEVKGMRIGPIVKGALTQTYGRAEASWSAARNIMAQKHWEGFESFIPEKDLPRLAQLGNILSGAFSFRGMGITQRQSSWLGAFVFFAPRFTASQFAVLHHVFRNGISRRQAISAILGIVTVNTILFGPGNVLMGKEKKIKPWPVAWGGDGTEVYTTNIGGHKFGPGGALYYPWKLIAGLFEDVLDMDEIKEVGLSKDQPILQTLGRAFRSKAAPFSGNLFTYASGQDYAGDSVRGDSLWHRGGINKDTIGFLANMVSPIFAQSFLKAYDGKWSTSTAIIIAEFFGMRVRPESRWEPFMRAMEEADDLERPYHEIMDNYVERQLLMVEFPHLEVLFKQAMEDSRKYGSGDPKIEKYWSEIAAFEEKLNKSLLKTAEHYDRFAGLDGDRATMRHEMEEALDEYWHDRRTHREQNSEISESYSSPKDATNPRDAAYFMRGEILADRSNYHYQHGYPLPKLQQALDDLEAGTSPEAWKDVMDWSNAKIGKKPYLYQELVVMKRNIQPFWDIYNDFEELYPKELVDIQLRIDGLRYGGFESGALDLEQTPSYKHAKKQRRDAQISWFKQNPKLWAVMRFYGYETAPAYISEEGNRIILEYSANYMERAAAFEDENQPEGKDPNFFRDVANAIKNMVD